jgi:putative adenylate-forming enzyme
MILAEFIKTRFFLWRAGPAYRSRLWKRQLAFLRKRSRFYASSIPAVNKRILMDNFNDINTVGIDKEQAIDFAIACEKTRRFDKKLNGVTVGLSSGTSGHRGVFLVSDREKALWAGNILAKMLPENHLSGVRVAFFMRADSELYQTISSKIIKFKFFDMYGDMNRNLEELREFKPTLLVAPPSMLLQIAKTLPAPQVKPRRVISIAEVLE